MSKTTKTTIEIIRDLKPRESLNRKEYKAFFESVESVLDTVYTIYRSRENGTATKETESEAMTKVTKFLHTLGKANGKYISVCEKTTDNGKASVLFDTLVYHSFTDRIYTTSEALASLECEKSKAGKAKNEAHTKLVNGTGTAKAYKEALAKFNDIVKKIEAERSKDKAEAEAVTKASKTKFAKFVVARLKAIAQSRYALSEAEAEAMRKIRNKEAKAKRSEAKKPEAKPNKGNGKKPEAVKPEAVKKTA